MAHDTLAFPSNRRAGAGPWIKHVNVGRVLERSNIKCSFLLRLNPTTTAFTRNRCTSRSHSYVLECHCVRTPGDNLRCRRPSDLSEPAFQIFQGLQRSEDWRENEDVHKLRLAPRLVNLRQNVDTSSLFLFRLSTQTSEKRGSFFAAATKQKLRGPLIQTLSNKITPHIKKKNKSKPREPKSKMDVLESALRVGDAWSPRLRGD